MLLKLLLPMPLGFKWRKTHSILFLNNTEKNGRVDGSSFFCVFECEVQVGSGATTAVACDCDGCAGTDVDAFGDEGQGTCKD